VSDMTEPGQNIIQAYAFVISTCMAVCLSYGFLGRPGRLDSSGADISACLENRINPNDASAASLARLPDIGITRARAIIAYRSAFVEKNGDSPAFLSYNDLQIVKGIGPKTAQNMSQWLKFE
jgi:DNA uptake protein ComE-like DNA-binding protein